MHHQVKNEERQFPLVIVCQDVTDPLNIGAIFRLADALGVRQIILCGKSPVPPHKKISKTARSTDQVVPFVHYTSTTEALEKLKKEGYQIVGLEITDESEAIDSYEFDAERPLVLVIGAESLGLFPETLTLLDSAVHIPMFGRNTSMNVVQACAIAVYELTKRF